MVLQIRSNFTWHIPLPWIWLGLWSLFQTRRFVDPCVAEVVDLWAMWFKHLTRALDNSLLWRRRCNASECIHLDTFRCCRRSKHVGVCWKNSWLELIIWDSFIEIDQILIRGLRNFFCDFCQVLINTSNDADLKFKEALENEIEICSRLKHPSASSWNSIRWLCDFIVVERTWIHF